MSRAPLSICLIFRDDPLLEQAVASVRPYVEEVCIVVDDDAPDGSYERVEKLADRFKRSTWRDDFAFTRNECLKLATQSFIGWMDTDDVVEGAEHFEREIDRSMAPSAGARGRLLGPYDYEKDKHGNVTRQQWRERIVPNDGSWIWEHPTHEGLVKKNGVGPIDPGTDYWMKGVRWVHQRKETGARRRSLEILRKWHAAGHDDAWTNINLAMELHAANDYAAALTHFEKYVWLSGWDEEKVIAYLRMADCEIALDVAGLKGGYDRAGSWIYAAHNARPVDFEPYFADAKLAMMRATMLGEPRGYAAVIEYCELALSCPETRTPIGRNPQERAFDVYDLMRTAAEVEQRWDVALEATEKALLARPGDPNLTLSRKRYAAAKLVASFGSGDEKVANGKGHRHAEGREETGKEEAAARVRGIDQAAARDVVAAAASRGGERIPDQGPQGDGSGEGIAAGVLKASVHRELRKEGDGYVVELDEGDTFTTPSEPGALVRVKVRGRTEPWFRPRLASPWVGSYVPPGCAVPFPRTTIAAPQPPLEIVFMCGPAGESWNPELVAQNGAGGSETAVVELAKRLAKMGHGVRVLGAPGLEGTFEGVDYETWAPDLKPKCDVLVAWRVAAFLPQADAKVRIAWPHDVEMLGMNYGYSLLADRIFALSEWHKANLIKAHGIPESQVFLTSNGVDPALYQGPSPERVSARAVYASSPDRGLGVLLDMWPAIKARVSDAELVVCYGFDNWKRQADGAKDEQHRFLVSTLRRRMNSLPGVSYRGRVNKRDLATLLRSSGALLSPTWFRETSGMIYMEARAAGMRIVTSPTGAIPETVGSYGRFIEGDWVSDDYQERFVEAAVDALYFDSPEGGQYLGRTREETSKAAIATLGWDRVCAQWDALFRELMGEAEHGALPAYRMWSGGEAVST